MGSNHLSPVSVVLRRAWKAMLIGWAAAFALAGCIQLQDRTPSPVPEPTATPRFVQAVASELQTPTPTAQPVQTVIVPPTFVAEVPTSGNVKGGLLPRPITDSRAAAPQSATPDMVMRRYGEWRGDGSAQFSITGLPDNYDVALEWEFSDLRKVVGGDFAVTLLFTGSDGRSYEMTIPANMARNARAMYRRYGPVVVQVTTAPGVEWVLRAVVPDKPYWPPTPSPL